MLIDKRYGEPHATVTSLSVEAISSSCCSTQTMEMSIKIMAEPSKETLLVLVKSITWRQQLGESHNLPQKMRTANPQSRFRYLRMSKEWFDCLLAEVSCCITREWSSIDQCELDEAEEMFIQFCTCSHRCPIHERMRKGEFNFITGEWSSIGGVPK